MLGITQNSRCWCSSLVVASVLIASLQEHTFAQITPDNTLPNNSSVAKEGNTFNITGGTQAGSNLFHSFREFSVSPGGTASFNNAGDIQNIITRVTGGSFSKIDGLIRAYGKANLFLINPSGIIFGQGARLDIGGSFVGTTANAIGFSERGFFSATNPNTPQLLTVNPSAFLFNQIATAPIQNNSIAYAGINPARLNAYGLRVPDGKSLLLVGGNVSMDTGQLYASGGRVELGGLSEPGTVLLLLDGDNLSLRFPENVTRADISLTNSAGVFVEAAGGGNIAVNAKNLNILEGSTLSAGIGEGLGTSKTVAGDITLNATGEIKVSSGSLVFNNVDFSSKGNGGNITIDSGSFSLSDGAGLAALIFGQGNAGNVTVSAKDAVSLADATILSTVEAGGVGKGGNIDINAATLLLIDGARLQTATREASATQPAAQGDAGNVNVNVTGKVDIAGEKNGSLSRIFSRVEPGTVGNGGNITINSGSLSLRDSALAASTYGQGNAGDLTINTRELLVRDGARVSASTIGAGKGGNLAVTADSVQVFGRSSDGRYSALAAQSQGIGNAGNLTINTRELLIRDGAFVSTGTFNAGKGGNLTVTADNVQVIGGFSILSTQANLGGSTGDGGDLTINTRELLIRDGAQVSASTFGAGKGGNLAVTADSVQVIADSVQVTDSSTDSRISTGLFASADRGSTGDGGDLIINTRELLIRDGAEVNASTFGAGKGGNLAVTANSVQVIGRSRDGRTGSFLSAGADQGSTGDGGDLRINTRELLIQDGAFIYTGTIGAGKGGNLAVSANSVQVVGTSTDDRINTGLFASSSGKAKAGDIIVDANSIVLNNATKINADTTGGGGNIFLNSPLLLLRRGSSITTNASGDNITGGNIIIDAKNGFIIAVPSENSDIRADSENFRGGSVRINAIGIFGTQFRDVPSDSTSDITATGESPQLNGTVELNTADIDPNSGLVQLPTIPVDTKVAQGCYSPTYAQNRFVIAGRGGLPPNPQDILTPDAPQIDWVSVKPTHNNRSIPPVTSKPTTSTPKRIVEATGATLNTKGKIVLSANSSAAPYTFRHNPIQCHGS
ncbi:two-partner secretion domain-containing protein [Nostoc sp.]|uniref:two-partner secretion domain-containing protein n=1 Tax=Nostoc sp. TaxID=1180 RepID=UPI002FFBED52